MECTRCAGLRVSETIYEGGRRVHALRCVLCGDIIDRVIILNRQRRRPPYPNRTCTPTGRSDRWTGNRPTMA